MELRSLLPPLLPPLLFVALHLKPTLSAALPLNSTSSPLSSLPSPITITITETPTPLAQPIYIPYDLSFLDDSIPPPPPPPPPPASPGNRPPLTFSPPSSSSSYITASYHTYWHSAKYVHLTVLITSLICLTFLTLVYLLTSSPPHEPDRAQVRVYVAHTYIAFILCLIETSTLLIPLTTKRAGVISVHVGLAVWLLPTLVTGPVWFMVHYRWLVPKRMRGRRGSRRRGSWVKRRDGEGGRKDRDGEEEEEEELDFLEVGMYWAPVTGFMLSIVGVVALADWRMTP